MNESILTSTKKVLGIASDYTDFDQDIIMLINSAFSTLQQIGVGPTDGFEITDASAMWDSFLMGDKRLNSAKTYVHLQVRLIFDPPATSFVQQALQEKLKELEWRLNIVHESGESSAASSSLDGGNPSGALVPETTVYDGGSP